MATRRGGSGEPKKETIFEVVAIVGFSFAVMFALIWFMANHKIVYYSTPLLRWLGVPWVLFNKDKWDAINEAFVYFRNQPRSIPLFNYFAYANACLLPLAGLICAGFGINLALRLISKKGGQDYRRRLTPMQAAKEISDTFPAVVPVLHLGPDLVANKLPLWRRQTFPEEIWQNVKVGGRPLAVGGKLIRERVETYFRGGEVKDGPHQMRNGRRWSKMLGFLAVDLLADAKNQEKICFPDRFSPQGKVLFGLLCAHAFGGREGKKDYQKAADQLNRSCSGQKNGLPNLTVAQWIYSKYRMNPTAKQLFGVHHWEYTYLFSLFIKAKKTGKATHTDFIWLKPLDRILFYVLNTVGRAVPHAESSAAFSILDFEEKCARYSRLPLRMRKDGTLETNICIHTSIEGFSQEFTRYFSATDDNDDWWKNLKTWDAATKLANEQASLKAAMAEQLKASKGLVGIPVQPDTEFDIEMAAKRKEEEAKSDASLLAVTAGAGGAMGGSFEMF